MALSATEKLEFSRYLGDVQHRERECVPYLNHAVSIILKQTPITLRRLSNEDRNFYGRSDFIIVAQLRNDVGQLDDVAEIWEVKAPQCYLMTKDDSINRYRPSQELLKAETQLIHYVDHARRDGNFHARFRIIDSANIKIGGILIGRDDRIVNSGDSEAIENAQMSLRIRKALIYEPARIRVMTWDRIIEHLLP